MSARKYHSPAAAEAAYPPIGDFVDVVGERVHYWDRGSGRPVVLIHGAGGNLRDWTFDLAPRLAARYRVIAFDRPGFGYTTRRSAGASDPAVQAGILRAAAGALGAPRPVVVGHSWGAALAMAWAVGEGPAPAGVVTVSGVMIPYAGPVGEVTRALGLNGLATRIYQRVMKARIDEATVRDYINGIFAPQQTPAGYAAYVGAALSLRDATLAANAADLNDLDAALSRLAPQYPGLAVPVEALHGTADGITMASQSQAMIASVPAGRLTLLSGVGHMAHHVRPEALEAALGRLAGA